MLKIRWSHDRLILNMEIPIPGKDGLYTEKGSWSHSTSSTALCSSSGPAGGIRSPWRHDDPPGGGVSQGGPADTDGRSGQQSARRGRTSHGLPGTVDTLWDLNWLTICRLYCLMHFLDRKSVIFLFKFHFFVPKGPIDSKFVFVQIVAWCQTVDKPFIIHMHQRQPRQFWWSRQGPSNVIWTALLWEHARYDCC